jgi:hypothetical protein
MHHGCDALGQYARFSVVVNPFNFHIFEIGPIGILKSPGVAQIEKLQTCSWVNLSWHRFSFTVRISTPTGGVEICSSLEYSLFRIMERTNYN